MLSDAYAWLMSDLRTDSTVTQTGDGNYEVLLSRDWEIWGPMGGTWPRARCVRLVRSLVALDRPALWVTFLVSPTLTRRSC